MNAPVPLEEEPRWEGVREVMAMSGPIILGSLSYTVMGFADRVMVARVGVDALAAVGSADIGSYTLSTLFMGIVSVVATFAAQCEGRGERENCARYAWQGLYLSLAGIVFALVLWPLAGPLFRSMDHTAEVTRQEILYFRIRLTGYFFVGVMAALGGFFQGVNQPRVPMYAAIAGNVTNLVFNYLLIYGKFGFPRLEIAGAAVATVMGMGVQSGLMFAWFLAPRLRAEYGTLRGWRPHFGRMRELTAVGVPAAMSMFLDVANWWIWMSFIIGRFGAAHLAANTIALSFNHITFMPVIGLHQGIAAITGQWIGRGDIPRAKARTRTTIKLSMAYMVCMGTVFAVFGGVLARHIFQPEDPGVVTLAHRALMIAALFQAFDAVNISVMGALRGAGDTRWMMWMTVVLAYGFSLPLAWLFAVVLDGRTLGAWAAATLFIMVLSAALWRRFEGERWRGINIFTHTGAGGGTPE